MAYPLVIAYRYKIYNNEFDLSGGDIKRIKIHPDSGLALDTVYHWNEKSLFSNFETANNGDTDLDAAIRAIVWLTAMVAFFDSSISS